jgi:ParB family transcriptional regulator, chromosome partitioning protein
MEKKPELVQISSAWNTREGAPLGRNHYVELQIKKAKTNGNLAKQPPFQKPCEKMADAIVMDGGNRGQVVKVCADPNCRVHHGDRPSPQQLQRDRLQERKRIEKEKIAITARHRVRAAVLERVSVPLKKADLLTIAEHVLASVPYNRIPLLLLEISLLEQAYQHGREPDSDVLLITAKRYRIDPEKLQKAVAQEFAAKQQKKKKGEKSPPD